MILKWRRYRNIIRIRDQRDSRSRSRPWKYTFSWSRSRIFLNKSFGLAWWDCTCTVSVSVLNVKNWSRRYQNPYLGKSPILGYGFGPKSSSLVQIVYRTYSKISKSLGLSLGLDHFLGLGLGLSLENTHFPDLGLSLEYLWRVSVSLVETVSLQSRSQSHLLRLYLLSLGLKP